MRSGLVAKKHQNVMMNPDELKGRPKRKPEFLPGSAAEAKKQIRSIRGQKKQDYRRAKKGVADLLGLPKSAPERRSGNKTK